MKDNLSTIKYSIRDEKFKYHIAKSELKKGSIISKKIHPIKDVENYKIKLINKKLLKEYNNDYYILKKTIRNIKFGEGGYRNAGHWIVINGFDATDAVERMNEVDADRYDLIFMDIQMSKMDGYMTTREIRTLKNNKKANIPIVAMTANVLKN